MRNPLRIALLVLIVLTLSAGAWFYLNRGRTAEAHVLTLYGDVDIREVQPAFNDSGHITRMLVQEGAVVHRGRAARHPGRHPLRRSAGAGESADAATRRRRWPSCSPDRVRKRSPQAKATMDALQVTYRNDAVTYRRAVALATTSAGTIQQRDDAKAAFDAARQQYEAARQAYILAVKGPRVEDIAAARAAYQAAEAAVALAQREFDDTRLYAPSDGVVEDRILEPGDMASPSTPVFTIALPSPLWVRAYVPESDLGRIRLGMAATVTTDSYPGQDYHGWIGYLSPTAEFTPKTVETPELRTALVYQLRVYVCDARGELRLGMPATVHIDLAQTPSEAPPGLRAGRCRPLIPRAPPPQPALRLAGVRRSFRTGKRVVTALDGITAERGARRRHRADRPGRRRQDHPDAADRRAAARRCRADRGAGHRCRARSARGAGAAWLHAAALRPLRRPQRARRTSTSTPICRACRRPSAPRATPSCCT